MSAFKILGKLRRRRAARRNSAQKLQDVQHILGTEAVPSAPPRKGKKQPQYLRRLQALHASHTAALAGSVYFLARLAVLLIAIALFVPWAGMTLWPYVYGLIGDLSITTWLIFLFWFVWPTRFYRWVADELSLRRRALLFGGIVIFYGLVLSNVAFDPYVYGYQPWPILALLALWVAWRGRAAPGITLILGIVLAAFGLHWLPSTNLWDSLFDPLLAIWLGSSLLRGVLSRRLSS